jgi:hypothetical protein
MTAPLWVVDPPLNNSFSTDRSELLMFDLTMIRNIESLSHTLIDRVSRR